MKKIFLIVIAAVFIVFGATFFITENSQADYVAKDPEAEVSSEGWNEIKSNYINTSVFTLTVDGAQANLSSGDIYMTEDGITMLSEETVVSAFGFAVNVYDETTAIIMKGSVCMEVEIGSVSAVLNEEDVELSAPLEYINGILYIPEEVITDVLGYEGEIDTAALTASYEEADDDLDSLPSYYSSEDYGRLPSVKNQGTFGACWAFAAISALEAYLLPETDVELSVDHIMYNNGFGIDGTDGGDQIMSMSYLLSWKGPVYEEDDPFGDSQTDSTLEAVFHVQEIQYLPSKDYEAIKEAVIQYGAVETAMYISTVNGLYVDYSYYNYYRAAYCYTGSGGTVNHEVIIIGWDDDFPAEYFEGNVTTDGAFICLNSWGDGFGTGGIFYVSYEDAFIGTTSVVYTKVESADNYDNIYQYDDVGWTANIGYNRNTAYMANVYTALSDELLEAVGFYAVGGDTDYEVYVVTDYTDESSLDVSGQVCASGTLENAGYYTIELDEAIELEEGQEFAVIVKVNTPGEGKPIAYETYTETERTSTVTTEGKYSYISSYGTQWENMQEEYSANVCLKAYTSNKAVSNQ